MSYAASNLSHPADSLKRRPPRRRAVTGTAPMSGGGGERAKLTGVSTRATNAAGDPVAGRVRNSSSGSLRGTAHVWLRMSPTGRSESPPGLVGDLGRPAAAARREVHEPAAPLERHIG